MGIFILIIKKHKKNRNDIYNEVIPAKRNAFFVVISL